MTKNDHFDQRLMTIRSPIGTIYSCVSPRSTWTTLSANKEERFCMRSEFVNNHVLREQKYARQITSCTPVHRLSSIYTF